MPAEAPQIYLATPTEIELSEFPETLARVLDTGPVACLRLSLSSRDEDHLARAADLLRETAHARDVPLVIDNHYKLVERLGLDGVHLTDGPRRVREVRRILARDAIVGVFCGTSRHDGMTAGEIGADYVSFGPVTPVLTMGDGETAPVELFAWWSEVIEIPVVAEGGLTADGIAAVAPFADFLCLADEIWAAPEGAEAAFAAVLKAVMAQAGAA